MNRPVVDYSQFSLEKIKKQLQSRGVSTKGSREVLTNRLKAEVDKAWTEYEAKSEPVQEPLFPNQGKRAQHNKPKKPKKSAEEIAEEQAKNALRRQEKLKRKAEHEKRVEEARERKRLKKEMTAKNHAEKNAEQKKAKIARQKCEAFLGFDVKSLEEQVRSKLDPAGSKIQNVSFDSVMKRFRIKFKTEAAAKVFTKGVSMKKPKKMKLDSEVSILPSPVETHCVMFLYPMSNMHPSTEAAKAWCTSQGLSDSKESDILRAWARSALNSFSGYGTIVNVYRERGFLVVQFSTEASANKMTTALKNGEFNGCKFVHLQVGTPTKLDKKLVTEQFGGNVQKKKVKKEATKPSC